MDYKEALPILLETTLKNILAFLIVSFSFILPALAEDIELSDQTEVKIVAVNTHELTGIVQGKKIVIRLLGTECRGKKSSRFLGKLLKGKKVVLRSDQKFLPILRDTRDRYIAHVEFKGKNVGKELIRDGICFQRGGNV